jgi:ribonuclease HI
LLAILRSPAPGHGLTANRSAVPARASMARFSPPATPRRRPRRVRYGPVGPAVSTASAPAKPAAGKRRAAARSPRTWTAAEIATMPYEVKIFTDGGCEPNPGKSGSGLALYRNDVLAELWYGLHSPHGTNNTAELNALHQALIMARRELDSGRSVAIFCDSSYAIQCITQWAEGWKQKGWTRQGGEIKNLALIKAMYTLHQTLEDRVKLMHVNGHVGVEGNELADRMSLLAIKTRTTDFVRYDQSLDVTKILAIS